MATRVIKLREAEESVYDSVETANKIIELPAGSPPTS
jgi:hypothetical protein